MLGVLTEADLKYYLSRMDSELTLAETAENSTVVRTHRVLAAQYGRLITANDTDFDDLLPPIASVSRPTIYHYTVSKQRRSYNTRNFLSFTGLGSVLDPRRDDRSHFACVK